jgi:hypothetical protein
MTSSYSIVDLPGWENLALDSANPAEVDAMLERLAHGSIPEDVPHDSATTFRREMHEHLTRIVDDARSAGAGTICLPTRRLGEIAVPASYTVSEWQDAEPGPVEPSALLVALAANSTGAAQLVDLDGQVALREEEIEPAAASEHPLERHAARRVTYTVSGPGEAGAWLLFTFVTIGNGTPTGPLADALVELFDAQLTTLRWKDA